jgi:hypothetical protein
MTARPRRASSTLVGGPAAGRVGGEPRTAFVLAGGAALGAMQAGMVRALYERGIAPDLLIGTSAGALNAAFLASRPATVATAEELAAVWRGLRRSDIFPLRPGTLISGLAGRHDHLITGRALRRLAARHLQLQRLEQAPVPLHLVAFDLLIGTEVRLSDGPRRSRRPPSCARSTPSGQGRSSAGWPARAPYPRRIRAARQRLRELLLAEHGRHYDVAAGWDRYTALTAAAAVACHVQDVAAARARVREAHETWRQVHDYCVDHVYGPLDVVVRLRVEDALPQVWNHLMNDWYDDRRPESQAVRAQAPLRRPERGPGSPAAARAPGRSERHASHVGRPSAVRLERVTVRT